MSDADDDLMCQVFAGDLPPTDPAAQELFARRPELFAELQRMQLLSGTLDRVGAEERTASAAPPCVPTQQQHRSSGWVWFAAAAAAVAVGATLMWSDSRVPPMASETSMLGQDAFVAAPVGVVSTYDQEFRWSVRLDPQDTFLLRIWDSTGRDLILSVPHLTEPRWLPTAGDLALMPQELAWEVAVVRPGGSHAPGTGLQRVSLAAPR